MSCSSNIGYITSYLAPLPYDIQNVILKHNRQRRENFKGNCRFLERNLQFPLTLVHSGHSHHSGAYYEIASSTLNTPKFTMKWRMDSESRMTVSMNISYGTLPFPNLHNVVNGYWNVQASENYDHYEFHWAGMYYRDARIMEDD